MKRRDNTHLLHGIFWVELLGFGVLLASTWLDDVLDLAHHLFGARSVGFRWKEASFESIGILLVLAVVMGVQIRLYRQVRYLRGFLPVCAFCKKIRSGEKWLPIEDYLRDHSNADFSHSFCPECARRNYGAWMDGEATTPAEDGVEQLPRPAAGGAG